MTKETHDGIEYEVTRDDWVECPLPDGIYWVKARCPSMDEKILHFDWLGGYEKWELIRLERSEYKFSGNKWYPSESRTITRTIDIYTIGCEVPDDIRLLKHMLKNADIVKAEPPST
jgi:hypothetical protein